LHLKIHNRENSQVDTGVITKLRHISEYIDNIKKTAYLDIENIENLALSKNPNSDLVKKYTSELKSNYNTPTN